jgi:hypothetical protein
LFIGKQTLKNVNKQQETEQQQWHWQWVTPLDNFAGAYESMLLFQTLLIGQFFCLNAQTFRATFDIILGNFGKIKTTLTCTFTQINMSYEL